MATMAAAATSSLETRPVRAADVMSRPAITVEINESMQDAWAAMMAAGVHHLVVCAGPACVGVLDDRTLFAHWPTGLFGVRSTPVRDLVRKGQPAVSSHTQLSVVADLMVAHDVDAVPVLTPGGAVAGIVTGHDLARAVAAYGVHGPAPERDPEHNPEPDPRTTDPQRFQQRPRSTS